MQIFADLWFFAYVAVAAIPAIILGVREKPIKYYLFFVTLFFVYFAMKDNTRALIYLLIFCLWQYALVRGYLFIRKKYDRQSKFYFLAIALAIAPLAVNKVTSFVGMSILGFLGISYITFKVVQMVIEIYDGIIVKTNPLFFFNFILFFPAITSGPIDRSRRFEQDMNTVPTRAEYLDLVGKGLVKIVLGVLYKFVLAAAVYQGILWLGSGKSLSEALIYMYCYGIYLFFDFAGYSQMAIGVSYIFGVKTPENFNKPFLSKDIKEFWDRWHITLSHWFRDFVFSRFMMQAIRKKWFKTKLTAASVGFLINMGLMGLWHGLELHYIIYGFYHGVLLALTEAYQKKSKFHKKHKKKKWYIGISWFITFNLVMFGFFIFSGRFTELIGGK